MSTPRAVIVSIGEELLEGRITDTNSQFFADQLLRLGVQVRRMITVGDAPGALRAVLEDLRGEWEVVLTTGGLGPTADDRVRAEVAALLGVPLVSAGKPAEADLRALYARVRRGEPPEEYLAQGRVPLGTEALANRAGAAWGFMADLGASTRLYCLPGPPQECRAAFFEGGASADLEQRFAPAARLAFGAFHTSGVPESVVEERVREWIEAGGNPQVGIVAGRHRVTVSVKAFPEPGRTAAEVLESVARDLEARLGELLWGRDDETLEGVVVELLAQRGETLATAESCTGGRLAARVVGVPGASRVFEYGWVTYANRAKVAELGVSEAALAAEGAVSADVAGAMAAGARERAGADWSLAITGVAGPDGGTPEKPVGLVYVGLCGPTGVCTIRRRQYARAGRRSIQEQSVRDALEALRRELLGLTRLPDRE